MPECTGCMDCEKVCPLTPFGIGIGNIIRKHIAGKEEDLIDTKDIWQCTMCFACDDSCPIGFKPRELMIRLRRRSKNYPEAYKKLIAGIRKSGNAFPMKGEVNTDYSELFKLCMPMDFYK
ncbi:MAG: 4Fe-4S dicluster domain-containing protein [Desulfobacterium sp.]|nr:4Fe-4S dicluster domain-containing protein [Desulfobacterium sp.]MBU3949362.1 (Fe-S)-binding protein [Pseudomonadota bacterium]MBU4035091.1 (Fe-S)-binding protein [Pseudomonadota bacterium]